jgi:nitrite reductase/ring-hydroxylating ferredoxin subunit
VRSGSRLNLVLLLRFDPGELSPETRLRAADGVVGYTAICTHTGCEVEEWLAEKQLLYCGCHASMFDPKDGARVVDGPAPRVLPCWRRTEQLRRTWLRRPELLKTAALSAEDNKILAAIVQENESSPRC